MGRLSGEPGSQGLSSGLMWVNAFRLVGPYAMMLAAAACCCAPLANARNFMALSRLGEFFITAQNCVWMSDWFQLKLTLAPWLRTV